MSAATNSNESYCTFTLASDVTAGGLPSEEEIAKQLESNDPKVGVCARLVCVCEAWFGGVDISAVNWVNIDNRAILMWG